MERSVCPRGFVDVFRLRLVGKELAFDFEREVAVGDECPYLVVEEIASGVDVGGANGGREVVGHYGFGVQESAAVEPYPGSGMKRLRHIGHGGGQHQHAAVAARGKEQSHVHSALCSPAQGLHHFGCGDEVGRL